MKTAALLVCYALGFVDGLMLGWVACEAWKGMGQIWAWTRDIRRRKIVFGWARRGDER